MNEYLTFQRVLELLESFQKESPILNSFGYGNLVDFSRTVSASTVNYPYMFVVPLSINYDENITEYQFSIIFADLLNYDLSNEAGCVSDMSLQAKRFMSYIKRGINTFPELYDNLDIVLPTGAIPFMERFGDHTAGVALDCVIQVFEDLNACDFYPSPTPTAQPTNTPSMTPSSTPAVTPTMTMTPSATNPLACRTYLITTTGGTNGSLYNYVDCNDGLTKPLVIPGFPYPPFNWCAKQNTLTYVSGDPVSISDIGTC